MRIEKNSKPLELMISVQAKKLDNQSSLGFANLF